MTTRSVEVCAMESQRAVQPRIDVDVFRDVVGRFATGITIVTTKGVDDRPAGFTCQAFMSLSVAPPRILIAPGHESVTWAKIRESRTFCVNILGDSHERIARQFARRDDRKFDAVDWAPAACTESPILAAATAWLDCRLGEVFELGDHCVAVGFVAEAATVHTRAPLIYFAGGFMPPLSPTTS